MFNGPISEYATKHVIAVQGDTLLVDVQQRLALHRISSVPVLDERERPIGVVSRADLLRVGTPTDPAATSGKLRRPTWQLPEKPVREVMTSNVVTVDPGTSVAEVSRHLLDQQIHRVFLESDRRLVGVASTKDVMLAIAHERLETPIEAYMTTPVRGIDQHAPLAHATEQLRDASISGLVVMDEDEPTGIFTEAEALEARGRSGDTPLWQVMGHSVLCLPQRTPVHRAASRALAMRLRRIIVMGDNEAVGVLTGINLAGAAALG